MANNPLGKIILTIQSAGRGIRRLGISAHDSQYIFKSRKVQVLVFIYDQKFECYTSCGPSDINGNWGEINPKTKKPFRKKGYDLNNKAYSHILDKWANELTGYSKRLEFELQKTSIGFSATFIKFADSPDNQSSH